MDTHDLSTEAYNAVFIISERFRHDLTLQFGLLSDHCSDEEDFLDKSLSLIEEFKTIGVEDLENVFFEDMPDLAAFRRVLENISHEIIKVKDIPMVERRFDE